jgi:hypothetical protein
MQPSYSTPATHAGARNQDQTTRTPAGLSGPLPLVGAHDEELHMEARRAHIMRLHLPLLSIEIRLHGWTKRPALNLATCVERARVAHRLHNAREAGHSRWMLGS